MEKNTTGILLQGNIRGWTIPIIEEYQQNFPDSEIVLSTWNNEDVSNITCKVIQSDLPEFGSNTSVFNNIRSNNYQIIGSRNGLKEMKSNIILKIRTDMFVHNPNIFKIFLAENVEDKIMYPHSGWLKESKDYWISDIAQLSTKDTLSNYWDSMPLHDGQKRIPPEEYFTKNYVLNVKKDYRSWKITHDVYFIRKRYHEDFQIEFEKYQIEKYQNFLLTASAENIIDHSNIYQQNN